MGWKIVLLLSLMVAPAWALTLRAGKQSLDLSAPGANLTAFVHAVNLKRKIRGLPDALNPYLLDRAKVSALVAALPSQSSDILSQLQGHDLWLDWEGLRVTRVAPTRSARFQNTTLIIDEVQDHCVLAHPSFGTDAKLARALAGRAHAALLEFGRSHVEPLSHDERWRLQALAFTWKINAVAWSLAEPNNRSAHVAVREALQSLKDNALPGNFEEDGHL
jgi:hypothetical protein